MPDNKNSKKVTTSSTPKKGTKAAPSTATPSKMAKALEAIKKALPDSKDSIVNIDPEQFTTSLPHIPTTSLILDQLIGGRNNSRGVAPCPGWPSGKIIQLYGMESSGKTTTALHMSKSVTAQGGSVAYIDFEQDVVPEYAKHLGVPIEDKDRFQLIQPESFEEGAAMMWVFAMAGIELIIVDSIPAATPKALLEKSVKEMGDKGQIGINASAWSAFLPRIRPILRKNNVTLLGISQVRAAITQYGPPENIPGGNAWKFYSSLRMRLQRKSVVTNKVYSALANAGEDKPIGQWVQAKLDKCKVSAQQGAESLFFIRFGEGIDNLMSLMEIAKVHKIIQQSASWYTWVTPSGEEAKFQGEEKLYAHIKSDPIRVATLEKQIRPHLTGAITLGVADEDEDDSGDTLDLEGGDLSADGGLDAALAAIAETTHAEIESQANRTANRILSQIKTGEQDLG